MYTFSSSYNHHLYLLMEPEQSSNFTVGNKLHTKVDRICNSLKTIREREQAKAAMRLEELHVVKAGLEDALKDVTDPDKRIALRQHLGVVKVEMDDCQATLDRKF